MRPFNLEEAKAGKPVVTRDGKPVKIICWDRKNEYYPIIALIGADEDMYSYTTDGNYLICGEDSLDLFMAGEKKEGWINLYEIDDSLFRKSSIVFSTEAEAKEVGLFDKSYITTIHITWEE